MIVYETAYGSPMDYVLWYWEGKTEVIRKNPIILSHFLTTCRRLNVYERNPDFDLQMSATNRLNHGTV